MELAYFREIPNRSAARVFSQIRVAREGDTVWVEHVPEEREGRILRVRRPLSEYMPGSERLLQRPRGGIASEIGQALLAEIAFYGIAVPDGGAVFDLEYEVPYVDEVDDA